MTEELEQTVQLTFCGAWGTELVDAYASNFIVQDALNFLGVPGAL